MTPVYIAARGGHPKCIELLIVGKADINIATDSVSGRGWWR